MNKPKPSTDLLAALVCETLGEASLRAAYYLTFNPARKRKIKVMWQLETQTKSRLLEHFKAQGFSAPKLLGTVVKGTLLGILFPLAPWPTVLENTLKETDHYLELFYRLEQQASEQHKPLFSYVVAHEQAIKRFAELEMAGGGSDSLQPMSALLNR